MYRKLVGGCPCRPLGSLYGMSDLASCVDCLTVFPVSRLVRRADGTLAKIPCVKICPDVIMSQVPDTSCPTVPEPCPAHAAAN